MNLNQHRNKSAPQLTGNKNKERRVTLRRKKKLVSQRSRLIKQMQKKQKPRAIPLCENGRGSFVTESKLTLFTARQAHESQRQSWGKDKGLFRKLADQEGRLVSQSNHLVRVWMRFLCRVRERSHEELKSKGRIERESRIEKGNKVKGSSVLHNISRDWPAFESSVLISSFCYSFPQVGRVRLSVYELNKGIVVYSQAEGQSPLRQAIIHDCNKKKKSNEKQVKETVPTWSQAWLLCNSFSSWLSSLSPMPTAQPHFLPSDA